MKNLTELLKQYTETIDAIFKSFGIEGGYGEINDHTTDYFRFSNGGDDVNWSDKTFDSEDGGQYGNEVLNKYENETHYLLYVDNGSGEKYYQVFDKSKEIK